MTGTPVLSGNTANITRIVGLDPADTTMVANLFKVWRAKYPRNLLRSSFYDAHQRFNNLRIAVPDQLAQNIGNVIGWPQKSVRTLADKSVFEGFETQGGDTHGVNAISLDNHLVSDVSQAIISCYKHSCSFLTVDYDPSDPSGERILITPRSATRHADASQQPSPSREPTKTATSPASTYGCQAATTHARPT